MIYSVAEHEKYRIDDGFEPSENYMFELRNVIVDCGKGEELTCWMIEWN